MEDKRIPIPRDQALKLFHTCDEDGNETIEKNELDGLFAKLDVLYPNHGMDSEEVFDTAVER